MVSQQPVAQSVLDEQGWRHTVPETESVTQVRPWQSQQGVVAHEAPSAAHRPATAAGPQAQAGYCAAASPVQKQEASSKVMHAKASQYGLQAVGDAPTSANGMQTSPTLWQAAPPQPSEQKLPMPPQFAGRTQLEGAEVIV